MSNKELDQMNKAYGLTARVGGRIKYTGGRIQKDGGLPVEGTIQGYDMCSLVVRLDDEEFDKYFHPTWMIEYLPEDPTAEIFLESAPTTTGRVFVSFGASRKRMTVSEAVTAVAVLTDAIRIATGNLEREAGE
jgi:hypothetical protein